MDGKYILAVDWSRIDGHMAVLATKSSSRLVLDPDALHWVPPPVPGLLHSPLKEESEGEDASEMEVVSRNIEESGE